MNIDASTTVGIIGTILAFIEIWKPKICLTIESEIGSILYTVGSYKSAMLTVQKQATVNSRYVWSEVLKGPQLITPEQFEANQVAALERCKVYGLAYLSLITYCLFLKPLKLLVSGLNFIGRGKAVGGIGIILNIVGLYIGWPT